MAKPEKPITISAVEGYDPRMLKLWRDGAISVSSVTCDNEIQAKNFRTRMYRLRLAMYRENHPDSKNVKKAKIALSPLKSGQWEVKVYPVTKEFNEVFERAGRGGEDDSGAPPLDD